MIAALALAAAAAAPAQAATETEPNDNITQPNGPMAPGVVYEGGFHRAGDHDRFVLYATGNGNVDITVENLGGANCPSQSFNMRLLNADGVRVSENSIPAAQPEPDHSPLAVKGPARYYVMLCSTTTARVAATGSRPAPPPRSRRARPPRPASPDRTRCRRPSPTTRSSARSGRWRPT
jgi:hypothetical protein